MKQEKNIDRPYGDKDAMMEILEWSKDRPNWQRDALRRIVQNGSLGVSDIQELVEICIDKNAVFETLKSAHLSAGAAQSQKISLGGVENPQQINALAADQRISFQNEGLTIVYGDNGSGKSGFVRVLKHACRSRDKNLKILRDVGNLSDEPQSALIKFFRGGQEEEFSWKPDSQPHSDLPLVSIFDSRSASTHVEKTNELAYSPYSMQVLEILRNTCDAVQSEIANRTKALKDQTPAIISSSQLNNDTEAGKFLSDLSANASQATLDGLTLISADEEKELASAAADLADKPERAAARLGSVKTRLSGAVERLNDLMLVTSDEVFSDVSALRKDLPNKSSLAKTASEQLFASSPLPDIGSELWRSLWDAARRYSDDSAYPEKTFPEATAEEDLCVLCQQPLEAEAVERRLTFEEFIKGETKMAEDAAKNLLDQKLNEIKNSSASHKLVGELVGVCRDEIDNSYLAQSLRKCVIMARFRHRSILKSKEIIGAAIAIPDKELGEALDKISTRISELTSSETSPERQALNKRHDELKDRKALAAMKSDVVAEISRRKSIVGLKAASATAAKRSVTEMNKRLSDKLVTDALRGRFAREIQKLEVGAMPLELQKSDRNAVSLFRVCFVERPTEPVGDVLSEGEHRCVALAAFLAELVTSRDYSGIVFDDPMSSLDHLRRKAVAKRLVEESQHRQVIVFTHDLPFMFELKREAEAQNQNVHYQHVHRRKSKPGHVKGELPLKAKPGLELANSLRSELKAVKQEFDDYSETIRTVMAKGFIEKIREALDQGIADFIMPVLGRFDNKIAGGSLFKLVILTDADVETVTAARRRLSEELHAYSEAINPAEVTHSDLVAEVAKLEAWMTDMKERQKKAVAPTTSYA